MERDGPQIPPPTRGLTTGLTTKPGFKTSRGLSVREFNGKSAVRRKLSSLKRKKMLKFCIDGKSKICSRSVIRTQKKAKTCAIYFQLKKKHLRRRTQGTTAARVQLRCEADGVRLSTARHGPPPADRSIASSLPSPGTCGGVGDAPPRPTARLDWGKSHQIPGTTHQGFPKTCANDHRF